jgi:hypothetical protein
VFYLEDTRFLPVLAQFRVGMAAGRRTVCIIVETILVCQHVRTVASSRVAVAEWQITARPVALLSVVKSRGRLILSVL